MNTDLMVHRSINIHAHPSRVWDVLTDPEKIKKYRFATETTTDLQPGGKLVYKGVFEGRAFKDTGTILEIEPGKVFKTSFWSSVSGEEELPENYCTLTYTLTREGEGTLLTLTQDNCHSPEQQDRLEENWCKILHALKRVAEEEQL